MMLVDERIGSVDLIGPLVRFGVPAEIARLEFADACFVGRGLHDAEITIGIELKETRDLISSLRSDRFSGHQSPGLLRTYDRAWLITEGIWRSTEDGVLEVMAGGWRTASIGRVPIMTNDLDSWLLSQHIRGGLSYWHCPTRRDTIRFLASLYRWWTSKSLDQHRSHQAIYQAPPDRALLSEPSTFRKMIAQLDGIGWERSIQVEEHFCTPLAMCLATEKEWQTIPGIGPKIAGSAIRTLRGAVGSGP